jgi:hypothetical protein|nr:MAG TPA: hypothetical protein [Caudoviricetes sp.]
MGGRGSSSGAARTAVTPESRAVLDLISSGQLSIERDQGDLYASRYNPIPRQDAEREVVVSIHGYTYEHRQAIKAAGFKWDPDNRVWVYSAKPSTKDPMLMTFAKEFTEQALGLRETPMPPMLYTVYPPGATRKERARIYKV